MVMSASFGVRFYQCVTNLKPVIYWWNLGPQTLSTLLQPYNLTKPRMAHGSHFIITPETCVEDMLSGVGASFPSLSVDVKSRVLLCSKGSPGDRSVGLLTGGGSGHEPFAAGFVGEGMLTGAVAGSVFSSPPPSHILTAICNVATVSPGGVMVFILNYTGDILNFGLAVERAKNKGYNVSSIIIDEDCAIDNPEGAGKRGLCGSLFMFKIAGGMAHMSKNLEEIYYECALIKKKISTLGVTIKPCNMPGSGPMFEIEEGYMEVGIGIHGEAGATKSKMKSADKIVGIILDKLCKTLNVNSGDRVCVIVNNLGGTSQLELFLVAGQVNTQLKTKGVTVVRQYVGSLMTSLDMAGIQVSLLSLPRGCEGLWLECLDAPTSAFAWPASTLSLPAPTKRDIVVYKETDAKPTGPQWSAEEAATLKRCLRAIAEALRENEQKLNELDRGCGDGDTGSTLRRMADAILHDLDRLSTRYPQQCFLQLSRLAEEVMGGTSGALYSLMLVGASRALPHWPSAWQAAISMACTYSKARIGNRTMFDAIIPACEAFKEEMSKSDDWREALTNAVKAADQGCRNTLDYKPLFGRATYVNSSNIKSMDAGAFGITVWMNAINTELL